MVWFVTVVAALIGLVLAIAFLNRFYRKSSREIALVRTGAGGQRTILDGGCLALPFLHKVSEVNMKTSRLEVARGGPKSIITKDRLRVDAAAEFYVRVRPDATGVATAAQALGAKTFRADELAETLEGKLAGAMLSVGATYTMDNLQDARSQYVNEVMALLEDNLAANGLLLESMSLTQLDQTAFSALDENNAFNAVGMRRLAEIIANNKKERAVIEADADVSVRQSHLDATKQRLLIEQQEEHASIEQQRKIETARASSQAEISEQQSQAERRREHARIEREREVRAEEIERDRALKALELEAALATEAASIDKQISLAQKEADEARIRLGTEAARAEAASAEESVKTARETASAERDRRLAVIRAMEQADVDETRVQSRSNTLQKIASAKASALRESAEAEKEELVARAYGTAAVIEAENTRTPEQVQMRVDLARIEALPDIVGKMMKPAEKIDTIRINHITGMNNAANDGAAGAGAPVNQVVDGVLSMALQLPAVKKLGEEVGLNIGSGLEGLSRSMSGDDDAQETAATDSDTDAAAHADQESR